jgi:tyrosyl-tRNA synthetase
MPSATWAEAALAGGKPVTAVFVDAGLASSASEARRLISQGGALLNDRKIDSVDYLVTLRDLRTGADGARELMLRAGKKRFFRILVE